MNEGDRTKNDWLVGKRVRLVRTNDIHTMLSRGDLGTVRFIDDFGTVHVDWDDGGSLGMIEQAGDAFDVIN